MEEFKLYRKKSLAEMRPYVEMEDMTGITISDADFANGSPKLGDMIVRDPANHSDQWLITAKFFENYEPV